MDLVDLRARNGYSNESMRTSVWLLNRLFGGVAEILATSFKIPGFLGLLLGSFPSSSIFGTFNVGFVLLVGILLFLPRFSTAVLTLNSSSSSDDSVDVESSVKYRIIGASKNIPHLKKDLIMLHSNVVLWKKVEEMRKRWKDTAWSQRRHKR